MNGGDYGPDFRFDIAQLRFATNSTIPQRRDAGYSRHCSEFFDSAVSDRALIAIALGGLAVLQSQRLRSAAPLLGAYCSFELHLPSRLEAFWVLLALSQETR